MAGQMRIEENGGPAVLRWAEVEVAAPGPGEALIRQTVIGVNFIDVYYRKGVYPPPGGFPLVPGAEGVGVVEAVGEGVAAVKPGDRVAYLGATGGYAEVRLMPADRLVRLPDDIDDRVAAASFLKGLTVYCLIHRTFPVAKGTKVLWHAAAGGVGLIACRWLHGLGAVVIGTVGSAEKAELALAAGCAHVVNYREEDFVARTRELTGSEGVDVVYDSVGQDTFPGSLDCLRPMGMWVAFGQSSGLPPPFTTSMLQHKGSLFATRPTIVHYLAKRADLEAAADGLFGALRDGTVRVSIGQEFALRDAAEAHRALEGRRTVGATVLLP